MLVVVFVIPVAAAPPKSTVGFGAEPKVPEIVAVYPPATSPLVGLMDVTVNPAAQT
jgi:hypothetical protein